MGTNRRECDFCLGLAQLLLSLGKWDLIHPLMLDACEASYHFLPLLESLRSTVAWLAQLTIKKETVILPDLNNCHEYILPCIDLLEVM